MTAILEINDTELVLHRHGQRLYRAPAIAIAQPGGLVFGEAALRQARIYPRQTNQQYLSRLAPDPLPHPTRDAANFADLVYHQLKEVAATCSDDVVLAVPGTLTAEQLGILLGISQEAGLTVSGFVDAAVAAVSTCPAPDPVCYLDLHLQHINVTELSVSAEVQRTRAYEVRECGLSNLLDSWVNLIADRFVRETRFDPLVTADTEQQLYNQVYDWVSGVHNTDIAVEILHAEQRRRVEVPRVALELKATQRYARLLEALNGSMAVLLSGRASGMPGLLGCLRSAGLSVDMVARDAVAEGCTRHLDQIHCGGGDLHLITRLPHAHRRPIATPIADLRPTHLLHEHRARSIDQCRDLPVRMENNTLWLRPAPDVSVNGVAIREEVRIQLGDVIDTSGGSYRAIRVDA